MYEHKIELDLGPTTESLKKLTEELMEEARGKVAHEALFGPLGSLSLRVWVLANTVEDAVEAEDGDSPLATAVRDITEAISIVSYAAEAAKKVSESLSKLRTIGREMHALHSLVSLATLLQILARKVYLRAPVNSTDEEDLRSDAAREVVGLVKELVTTVATARTRFAPYESGGQEEDAEES